MKPVTKKQDNKKDPVPPPKGRPNPFSFYTYDPKAPEAFPPPTGPPPQPVEEDVNPFSFFKPPPPVKIKTQNNKDLGSRLPPQPSSLDDFDDSDEEPIFPKMDPLFPEDNEPHFPSDDGDDPVFRNIPEPKKERSEPLFPKGGIPFVHDKDDKIRELTEIAQVMKKRAETAEALVKRHEVKLQDASQKIADLKEKERKESAEMENALKLIEKNLASMKIRAEKAENQVLILQQRLKMNIPPQSQDPNHEKNLFVLSMMQKISTEGQQGMNLLFQGMKEFNLLMETLRNMHVISEDV